MVRPLSYFRKAIWRAGDGAASCALAYVKVGDMRFVVMYARQLQFDGMYQKFTPMRFVRVKVRCLVVTSVKIRAARVAKTAAGEMKADSPAAELGASATLQDWLHGCRPR